MLATIIAIMTIYTVKLRDADLVVISSIISYTGLGIYACYYFERMTKLAVV